MYDFIEILSTCSQYSSNNAVSVTRGSNILLGNSGNSTMFYFFLAFGCPELNLPNNAHLSWSGNQWVVKCNHTDGRWPVHCDGNAWVGSVGKCAAGRHIITHVPGNQM